MKYRIRPVNPPWNDFGYMSLIERLLQRFIAAGFSTDYKYLFISNAVGRKIERMDELTLDEYGQVCDELDKVLNGNVKEENAA